MKLSVVVVTWNSAADIDACIDSINFGSEFEVIVVDNASSDSTRDKLDRHHHLRFLSNRTNLGYARANNQGFRLAAGEYVLLLNPDTRVELGALDSLARFLDEHREYGAAAPRLVNPDGSTQFSIRSLPTAASLFWELVGLAALFPRSRTFGRWKMKYFDYERDGEAEQPMASCLMVRKSVLDHLGGMDERFPMYYNDVDFSRRMADAGWKTAYVADARVVHRHGGSTKQVRARMIRESHRAAFRYLRKHDRTGRFWAKATVLLPLLEITALLRVLALRLCQRPAAN
jgi:hypothetical protein